MRATTTLTVVVSDWTERRTLTRFLGGVPALRRLALCSRAASVDPAHPADVELAALARPGLQRLALKAVGARLCDGFAAQLSRALVGAALLEREALKSFCLTPVRGI